MAEPAKVRSSKEVFDRKVYPAGWTVFHEGDNGNCAWLIESGRVAIHKAGPGGRVPLGILGAGELFGEMALIDDAPRMATATTIEASVLVPLGRAHFERRLSKVDPFIAKLLRILVQNVRSITDRHVELRDSVADGQDSTADRPAGAADPKPAARRKA